MDKLRSEKDVLVTMRDDYWCSGTYVRMCTVEALPEAYHAFREWVRNNIAPETIRFEDHGQAMIRVGAGVNMGRRTLRMHFPNISDDDYFLIKLRWFR